MSAGCVSSGKQHFVITFAQRGGVVEFHRWEMLQDEAVADTQAGFMFAYGFWPGEPVGVRTCSGCGDREPV